MSCHGENFSKPIDPSYPKIAGQHKDYLFVALMEIAKTKAKFPGQKTLRALRHTTGHHKAWRHQGFEHVHKNCFNSRHTLHLVKGVFEARIRRDAERLTEVIQLSGASAK